jgi:hypothetical protein
MSSFEFNIDGPPVSQQSRQRQGLHEWKDLVRDEAERMWNPSFAPSNASLQFSVTYYYEDVPVEMEDIVKPIMDALIGLVYNDNSQITEITQSRQNLYSSFRIPDLSPTLADGFGRGCEFLHVQIDGLESYDELATQARVQEIPADSNGSQEAITDLSDLASPPEQEQPFHLPGAEAAPPSEPGDPQYIEETQTDLDLARTEMPDAGESSNALIDQQDPGSNPTNQQTVDELREPELPPGEAEKPDEDDYVEAGSQEG